VIFDKRGVGLSDPVPLPLLPTLETWMDDVLTVMAAAESERAAVFATAEAGPMAMLFAATHPARTSALVLLNTLARFRRAPDYRPGVPDPLVSQFLEELERSSSGAEPVLPELSAPSAAADPAYREWAGRYQRQTASPGTHMAIGRMLFEVDVRDALPVIAVPTLVLHRAENRYYPVGNGRYLAEHIPGARYVELPGADHLFWVGDAMPVLDEIEEFLTGARQAHEPDRVLATVAFTDIVGSTEQASDLGDRRWRELLDGHDTIGRTLVEQFGGRVVKMTGDGLLATFDGPARAIRCVCALRDRLRGLGLEIRAGVHTGEVELRGDDVGGIAVHIGQRVTELAAPGEVLVSRTVTDLVAGSGITFADRGSRVLKGVPDEWQLFVVEG
jgi:class 3 adenylate cyclase